MSDGGPVANAAQAHRSDKYSALEASALTLEDKAKSAEILKNLADARNSDEMLRIQLLQLKTTKFATWVPLLTPICTLIGTTITVVVQNKQLNTTLREQRQQSESVATLQRDASEDAQWREALKSVSFVLGAFAMQGFFRSPRYGSQARAIASALLTDIPNVNAFDEVLSRIRDNTTGTNFTDLRVVAQMLGFAQRARFHMKGAAENFDGLNFTRANLNFAILYNASSKGANFNRVKLKDAYVREVALNDADFNEVTVYDGSRWEDSNWWDAKCIDRCLIICSRLTLTHLRHRRNLSSCRAAADSFSSPRG